MTPKTASQALEEQLSTLLGSRFRGLCVSIEHSKRWNRPCVTFRWSGFAGLLPEERYRRLVAALPAEVREQRLAGFVWLELADGEDVEAFLKQPRSEDIADREEPVYQSLMKIDLFASLTEAMGKSPEKKCDGEFGELSRILQSAKFSGKQVTDAKLLMIRHHAYCDCQVLQTAKPELEAKYCGTRLPGAKPRNQKAHR